MKLAAAILLLAQVHGFSLTTPSLSIASSRGGRITSTLLSSAPTANTNGDNANTNTNTIQSQNDDQAPCFDGVCSSDPLPSSVSTTSNSAAIGEATQRLGIQTGPTVWSEFGRLAAENPDIANLGQGFPDWLPPQFAIDAIVESATDVAHNSPHQYTRTAGHPKLVKELAGRYSKHLGRDVDPMSDVAITIGASQALYLSLQTLIQPGDEVILFEPFFDLYVNQIKLAGGTPVYVPLTFQPYDTTPNTISPGEWILDPQALRDAINPSKTRAIVLNSPHNPTGKIFTREEMSSIASAVTEVAGEQCVVLSDEVYKYIVHSPPKEEMEEEEAAQFANASNNNNSSSSSSDATSTTTTEATNDNTTDANAAATKYHPAICQGHVHFATLPGMSERTITISSAGKTFSATGWQVGWAIGPSKLIAPMHQLLPYVQFCASTVIQEALARALPKADLPYEGYASYYEHLKAMYTRKRDLLASALEKAGFVIPDYDQTPGGGFFIFARIGKEIADSIPPERLMAYNAAAPGNVARQDWALCQWMAEEKGILCIPASPFFSEETVTGEEAPLSDQFVRIAFCKTNDTILAAAEKLMLLREDAASNVIMAER